ncbi:MAG TPA: hypothetical protein VEJ20_06030, partial [Candidatus Eremiobacteraceae bacterium]|nr:hypothetical protein [Candidatus Eremiobacteraceae bacterium]
DRKVQGVNVAVAAEVRRLMQLRSYAGGRLVCIIPNFDAVTYEWVYNLLLKEIEEPDPGKLFLFTAERLERILPTIRSRTELVRFDRLAEDVIVQALVSQHGVPRGEAERLARRSQGSLGEALAERGGDVAELRAATRAWALACLSHPDALRPMPSLGKDDARSTLADVLRSARMTVRDVMATAVAGDDAAIDLDALADYRKARAAMGVRAAARAARALAAFDEADRIFATNVAPAVLLGWLQIELRSAAAS